MTAAHAGCALETAVAETAAVETAAPENKNKYFLLHSRRRKHNDRRHFSVSAPNFKQYFINKNKAFLYTTLLLLALGNNFPLFPDILQHCTMSNVTVALGEGRITSNLNPPLYKIVVVPF